MASFPRPLRAKDQEAESVALFLRNIPAKCEAEILHSFLESKGLTDFEMDVPLFPDGKSRGFAVIRLRNSFAVQKSIRNIEGQFVPGFQRTTPLHLEPLKGKGPRRCFQSQKFMPTETSLPLPHGLIQAEASAEKGVPNSEPGSQILADGMKTAVALPSEMVAPHEANINTTHACTILRHEPAYTQVLGADGKLSFFL